MAPHFETIDIEDSKRLTEVEQRLMKELPESVQMLVILRLAIKKRYPPQVGVSFHLYCEDENKENEDLRRDSNDSSDCPFIVCIQRPNFHTRKGVIILTPKNPTEQMIQTFDSFLKWDEPMIFQGIQQAFWEPIWSMCRAHGNLVPKNNQGFPMIIHAIRNIEKAKNLDVPLPPEENVEVRELRDEDVPQVADSWEWAKPHSKEAIGYCVGSLLTCGAFENGERMSSVLMSPLGTFNVLHTPDKYRKRGFGQLVMKWISREGARVLETFPLAETETFNEASMGVLKKIGYEVMYYTRWFVYEPKS